MVAIDKSAIRTAQIARMTQAASTTQKETPALLAKLFASPFWQAAKSIATTVSSPIEVPTAALIARAHAEHKAVFLPRVMPKRQLAFLPDPGAQNLVTSRFGIPEPPYQDALVTEAIDLVIVPGVAFDPDTGARVGYGGGYYDRWLQRVRPKTVALVASALARRQDWVSEPFDIPIDVLMTKGA